MRLRYFGENNMNIPVKFGESIEISDVETKTKTFKDLGLKEKDVEEFLRKNVSLIFGDEETLLIVGQQVRNESQGISDLTAIDGDGNIVLIEIKRDKEDIKNRSEAFEFQAIRYAASYGKIKDAEEIVELVYSKYVQDHPSEFDLGELTPIEKAKRELNQFLKDNEVSKTFNLKQRIILIASEFDEQTLSAVAWLIANNVDISCFTIKPSSVGKQDFLNIERLLPPSHIDDFYVGLAGSSNMQSKSTTKGAIKRNFLPRMDKLFEWGIIKKEDKLKIKKHLDHPEAEVIDENTVRYKGKDISYNKWGQEVTQWSTINIYDWAILIPGDKTLSELRAEKMRELDKVVEK